MNIEDQIEKYANHRSYDNSLFYWDNKSKILYTHDMDLARDRFDLLGFPCAHHDDFELIVVSEDAIHAFDEIQGKLDPDNMCDFLKGVYEALIQERTYTATEYNKLWDEKIQLEKTLNSIKGLL